MVKKPRAAPASSQADYGSVSSPEHGGALYCLSYVSTQTRPMSNSDLLGLLELSRERNARLGITGLLMHREGSYFQILEGEEEEVRALFAKIEADGRHDRVEVVTEGPSGSRDFSDWQMAFIELDGQDFSALPGFSDVLKNTPQARDFLRSLSRSKKLALLFTILD